MDVVAKAVLSDNCAYGGVQKIAKIICKD